MEFDPRALSDMLTPAMQNPPLPNQSYLMDSDTNGSGRSRGARQKTNGRSRSSTNPVLPSNPTPDTLVSITRTVSTPTPATTTPRVQPKPRRGLFSLLASAAAQPSPPSAKADSSSSTNSNPTPDSPVPQSSPTFMQNLARRLSGSAGKNKSIEIKNAAPQCARRTLNVNHVRPRPEIKELQTIQLRRVCFVADETLISKRMFKATECFETELPREQKLKVKDLREAYYRCSRNRETTGDERIAKAFASAEGLEMRRLDLSMIKFGSKDAVVPVCDVLSLARGLEEIILDHCELTDEQLRLFLTALLYLRQGHDTNRIQYRGVAKLSLVGNNTFGLEGWRSLAWFVHMNADLASLDISHIPVSMEAANILARAIALPNPARRQTPPEFVLHPVSSRQRQRKFSFRRPSNGSGNSDLVKVPSPIAKRQPSVSEEIQVIEEDVQGKNGSDLPNIIPQTPLSPSFVNTMPSPTNSSFVDIGTMDIPSEIPENPSPPLPRRKVEELKMSNCELSTEILELFLPAVTSGGVRQWHLGGNKFDREGMNKLAGLFSVSKPDEEQEAGRSTPPPLLQIQSDAIMSRSSVALEETKQQPTPEESKTSKGQLHLLSLAGTDLSSNQLDPLLDVWLNHPNTVEMWSLDLTDCHLGRDLSFFSTLLTALCRFPNFRILTLDKNPIFANPGFTSTLRQWLPRLPILRRLNLVSTGLQAQHLVELARVLPDVKNLIAIDIRENPIYEMHETEEEAEGQTEDVSGLTALEAALRYCRQLIEVELPEGGGDEGARLRYKIFLRCFKNIETMDHAAHPNASDDPAESGLGRKRAVTEETKEIPPQLKEGRDKFEVDRGHGVARALETVLLHAQSEDKAQDVSLDLLYRARKIKERLQPALIRGDQDEAKHRRLLFLNQVLAKVIDRFEIAFPECAAKPNPDSQLDSSDDENDNDVPPKSPTILRRSSSMTEIARGLELEEGDVHRFGSLLRKRDIQGAATEMTGQQLLEAILKVDKETVEREVWDKDGLRKVLRRSIDAGVPLTMTQGAALEEMGISLEGGIPLDGNAVVDVAGEQIVSEQKKDSDSHSI